MGRLDYLREKYIYMVVLVLLLLLFCFTSLVSSCPVLAFFLLLNVIHPTPYRATSFAQLD